MPGSGTYQISGSKWPTEKAGRAVGRDSQIFACQLARCRSAEGCGSPAATSKGHRPFEAPTEPTGETSSLQGSRVKPLPSDMMLCVISYWVLFGAKWRQIQQLRCCVLPGTQSFSIHERICSAPFGRCAEQISQDHADHRHPLAGEAAEAGSQAEGQGAGQGESTGFRSATVEPFAGRTGTKQTNSTPPHTGGALGNLNLIGSVWGRKLALSARHPVTRIWRCK